jgi:hypothetical protein
MFLAGRIPDPHAAAFDDDPRIDGFERLVLDQVMPDMGAVGLDNCRDHWSGWVVHALVSSREADHRSVARE